MMKKIKNFLMSVASVTLVACGAQNNISFNLTPGNCPDGAINAPYCMAIKIQNNEGGQNYINSTNYPINNLSFSAYGANNLQYPIASGSSLDPNGCLGKTLGAGSSCTFYVKLIGESVPVGEYSAINFTANYTVKKQLFSSGGSADSSSITFYQVPNLIMTNTYGIAKNYSNNQTQSTYSVESGGSSQLNSIATDSYYGFLWAATSSNLFVSGNQTYTYNKTESTGIGTFSNVMINGSTIYPVGSSYVYNASVYPINSLTYWYQKSTVPVSVQNGVSAISGANVYLASSNRVYYCPTASSNPSCTVEAEAVPDGTISALSTKTPIGNFTGLVIGTTNGLYVESGVTGLSTNLLSKVLVDETTTINSPIQDMISDNLGNIYAIDSGFNLYKLPVNSGNKATLLTTVNATGTPVAMTYDNAGQILYMSTLQGQVYACFDNNNLFSCQLDTSINGFDGTMYGLNIVTSLESYL